MKHLKTFRKESPISLQEAQDIFIDLKDDNDLYISNTWLGNSFSFEDEASKVNYNDSNSVLKATSSIPTLIIRLKSINNQFSFNFKLTDNIFQNLSNSIGHIESQYNLSLNNIFLNGLISDSTYWFKSVESFQKVLDSDPVMWKLLIKKMIYIDISFKLI